MGESRGKGTQRAVLQPASKITRAWGQINSGKSQQLASSNLVRRSWRALKTALATA